ncbi:MAG: thioredoxin family protein [Chloroflexi bacterium]|nr:thioredoxin family protein [Chloroflexota bacterium]
MDRLLWLGLILLALGTAWLAYRVWKARLIRSLRLDLSQFAPLPDQPTILYFTGAGCTQCHARQTPALEELRKDLAGQVNIVEIDALARRDLAGRFRVLTLPTTVVITDDSSVKAINHGFASTETLRAQLQQALEGNGPRDSQPDGRLASGG